MSRPSSHPEGGASPTLARVLSLPLLVLYGMGVTIGAGIYVLIGATAGRAGVHAPLAFIVAALAMVFSAASFAELSSRFPVSAGEAAYVRNGLGSRRLALLTGLMVIVAGVVSCAAITLGGAGYLRELLPWPEPALVIVVLLLLGAAAAWGIMESVTFAAVFTVIETIGLFVIIGAGFMQQPDMLLALPEIVPDLSDTAAIASVFATGLLAFFAFIGFEDMVNIAEEVRDPTRNMPRGIFITLVSTTIIYVLVVFVAVKAVPPEELGASSAPLSLVFQRLTGASPVLITTIAIVATLNGVIVQIIMASRVLYGLAALGDAPAAFARIHPRTRTPLLATGTVVGVVMILALFFPLQRLAEMTSSVALCVFALVNLALLRLKLRKPALEHAGFSVPAWVPAVGVVVSLGFLAGAWLA